ncbi:hypothetical protein [Roseococcus sp. YIM B11640]|uniref:hypothetical protein n=1 Tax=Roseococcus sp. YIM B11640 TaxID=3133973 RepID=UPI003C7B996C
MRAFCLLAVLVLTAQPVFAQAPPRPGRAASVRAPYASSAALAAARRYLCPNGGTPQGRGRCAPRGSGIGLMGEDPEVRNWDRGIAPATHGQAPCPPGTTASSAIAQPGVTRCVAG